MTLIGGTNMTDKLLIFLEKFGDEIWSFSDEREMNQILRLKYLERSEQGFYDGNDDNLEFNRSIRFMNARNSALNEYEMFVVRTPKTLED
jgi:hypothetical protein